MLRYMYQIKIFSENSGHHEVKFDNFFFFLGGGVDLPYFALKCDNFLLANAKISAVSEWSIFPSLEIIKIIKEFAV